MHRLPHWLLHKPIASIDFEMFSTAGYRYDPHSSKWYSLSNSSPHGLGAVGAAAYAQDETTDVVSLAYRLLPGCSRPGSYLWVPYASRGPQLLFDHIEQGGLVTAWNSFFEWCIWNLHCVPRRGWPPIPIEQMIDTMGNSYAHSLPGGLAHCAKALGSVPKDTEGKRLINKFSKQQRITKTRNSLRIMPRDDIEDAVKFYSYNMDDVEAEVDIMGRIPHLSDFERRVWIADQRINTRGVHVDVDLLKRLITFVNETREQYRAELQQLTGGEVKSVKETAKMLAWLRAHGLTIENLQKETVVDAIALGPQWVPPGCLRALQLRQLLSQASVDKLFAIERRLCADGRLRGLFQYAGAGRTSRWGGRGPQPQNIPGGEFEERVNDITDAPTFIKTFPNPLDTVKSCLRGLFCASPGHDLICSDYSAIEAVGLAMIAREQWRIDVFRTHGKIYEMSASKISGVPFEEFMAHKERTKSPENPNGLDHPLRKKIGKVAELASGYKGWIGAWKNFGADEHFSNDDEIKQAILAWRKDSPAIVEFWGGQVRKIPTERWAFTHEYYGIEGAAIQAVLSPGNMFAYNGIYFVMEGDALRCGLPSGRKLTYHNPRLDTVRDRYSGEQIYQLSYMGWNNDRNKGPIGWIRLYTHGGKLTENIVQAACRDIQANALVNLEDAGYRVVLHVHDEICAEVPKGWGSIEEFERIMSTMPAWAADWPVVARGGWRGLRFRKD